MILIIVLFFNLSILTLLPLIFTPLRLGLWIILLAIIISISLFYIASSWFRFILFLVYIGGLLVIFAYFIAINPNKKIKIWDPLFIPIIATLILLLLYKNYIWLVPALRFSKLYNHTAPSLLLESSIPLLIIISLSLLLILLVVVKITNRREGPFRPFN